MHKWQYKKPEYRVSLVCYWVSNAFTLVSENISKRVIFLTKNILVLAKRVSINLVKISEKSKIQVYIKLTKYFIIRDQESKLLTPDS